MALAPSNHGTTLDGLARLASLLGVSSEINGTLSSACEACVEQEQGSAFLAGLNAAPTVPGVRYTVIESVADEVDTPYSNAFLPPAPNVKRTSPLQEEVQYSTAATSWRSPADPVALADMLNAARPVVRPVNVPCLVVLPVTGPVGQVPNFQLPGRTSPRRYRLATSKLTDYVGNPPRTPNCMS